MEEIVRLTDMLQDEIRFADPDAFNRYETGRALPKSVLTRPFDWEYFFKTPTNPIVKKALSYLLAGLGNPCPEGDVEDVELSIDGFADNLAANLECVRQHVTERKLSPEFVIAWGNYRATDILLHFILHDLAPAQFDRAHKGESIQPNRYWYALWIENLQHKNPGLHRKDADLILAKIFLQIVEGKRTLPSAIDKEWFLPWVAKMLSKDGQTKKPKDRLSGGYTSKEISKAGFANLLVEAKEFERFLPPVGEDHYR